MTDKEKKDTKKEFCFNACPGAKGLENWFVCSECGHSCDGNLLWKCPGCGRSIL